MTSDAQRGLRMAHGNGGRLSRFRLDETLPLPASRMTSCASMASS
jgi:hypothetical protein